MMTREKKNHKTASVKAMDYLARRDHSEKELAQKLSQHYEAEEIQEALTEVKKRGWLTPPLELSEKAAEEMHRKGKGHLYISHFLTEKGLPELPMDSDRELEKALELIERKAKDPNDTKKVAALLKNRGFDTETIGKVIHEIRRNSQSFY